MDKNTREWEYFSRGDYHKKLDKNWKYYPIYITKMDYIDKFIASIPKNKKILDIGCGEGILVEKYSKKGYNIKGIDFNYESEYVEKGDITNTRFKDNAIDVILCLDVLEHLSWDKQDIALKEIKRILKKNGICLISVPNLAHFASRLSFMFTGNLIRTSKEDRHIGDRPINEYIKMIKNNKFRLISKKGLFPTFPLSSILTYFFPSRVLPLHRFLNTFFAYPNWCFQSILLIKNNK